MLSFSKTIRAVFGSIGREEMVETMCRGWLIWENSLRSTLSKKQKILSRQSDSFDAPLPL